MTAHEHVTAAIPAEPRPLHGWYQQLSSAFELPGGRARILEMEGLRGLAVAMIFFVHFASAFGRFGGPMIPGFQFLHRAGPSGVDLFFLLSSYLVYGILLRHRVTYASFLGRRAQRIYPAFLVMFGVYLLLSRFLNDSKLPHGFAAGAAYIAANLLFLPGIFAITPFITVAWSISYEFLSYLLFPLIVWGTGMQRWSPLARLRFWAIGAGLLAIIALRPQSYLEFHPSLLMFFGGPVIYECTRTPLGFQPRRWHEPLIVLACGASWYLMFIGRAFNLPGIAPRVALLFALGFLIAYSIQGVGGLARFFRITPLRWLGNMSYSYYLVHGLTLVGLRYVLIGAMHWSPGPAQILGIVLPLCICVSLSASAVLFLFVEKPYSLSPASGKAGPREIRTHAFGARLSYTPDVADIPSDR